MAQFSTRGSADIVFVVDGSASMRPCIDALKSKIKSFVHSLQSANTSGFDVRLEFISIAASPTPDGSGATYRVLSSTGPDVFDRLYKIRSGNAPFWASSVDQFEAALSEIKPEGDEDNLLALDMALDLPWREDSASHRMVVLLTDEPPETGCFPRDSASLAPALVEKLNALRVKLLMVAPYSEILVELQCADGADYIQLEDHEIDSGLSGVDFGKIFDVIAKSVSVETLQGHFKAAPQALFGQDKFGRGGFWDPGDAR